MSKCNKAPCAKIWNFDYLWRGANVLCLPKALEWGHYQSQACPRLLAWANFISMMPSPYGFTLNPKSILSLFIMRSLPTSAMEVSFSELQHRIVVTMSAAENIWKLDLVQLPCIWKKLNGRILSHIGHWLFLSDPGWLDLVWLWCM
jgi:hypothetical protein